jgi:opacity protein-like surface antigen
MKALLCAALIAFASLSAHAADAPSVTGKWTVHTSVAGNESETVCSFTQTGADLTGTCKKQDGTDAKVTGKVDGAKVNWQFDSDYNGTTITLKYEATIDPATGKISGSVTVDPFGVSGDVSATQDAK